MDEKTLKVLAMKSMSAMLSVVLFSAVFTGHNNVTIYANEYTGEDGAAYEKMEEDSYKEEVDRLSEDESGAVYANVQTENIMDSISSHHLVVKKNSEKDCKIILEDRYMEKKIRVSVLGLDEKAIRKKDITFGGSGESPLKKASVSYEYNPDSLLYIAVLDLQMDNIYVPRVYEDEENIYIDLLDPHQVYDKVIVVDAGHGGNDVGSFSDNMKYFEKDINLSIVLYLKELLDQEPIKVYYTRLADEKVYLNPRLDLANDLKADMFISVHCNSSDCQTAKGSEVLYSTKKQKKLPIKSDKLATIFLNELVGAVDMEKRGIVNGNDIYIVGNAKVPVALVEVGFISNEEDLQFLKKKGNRKQIAEGIYNGIMEAYEVLGAK